MNWNRKIRLLGHDVDVQAERKSAMDPQARGVCMMMENRIVIDASLPVTRQVETFFHELTHFFTVYPIDNAGTKDAIHETVAYAMGEGLAQFCRDNKNFVRDLLKAL